MREFTRVRREWDDIMRKKGLVVDDDKKILEVLTRSFEKQDVDTISVSNGFQAIGRLLSEEIDFILIDIDMPDMNGLELVQFIQSNFPDLPVFLMSGDLGGLDEQTQKSACVKKVFKKPFNLLKIIKIILSTTDCGQIVH